MELQKFKRKAENPQILLMIFNQQKFTHESWYYFVPKNRIPGCALQILKKKIRPTLMIVLWKIEISRPIFKAQI